MNDVPYAVGRLTPDVEIGSHLALDGISVTDIVLIPVPTPQFPSFTLSPRMSPDH
jgi:hypothetical protein